MLLKGDKVMHIRHPEWDVGIVEGVKYPGILVRFPADPYAAKPKEWICSEGNLYKVNGFSKDEIRQQAAVFEEIMRLRRIEEARKIYER